MNHLTLWDAGRLLMTDPPALVFANNLRRAMARRDALRDRLLVM